MITIRSVAAVAAMTLAARGLAAQQPNASAAAFGMAGNYTAAARGYDAIAWNPAALGMKDAPGFSMNILSVGAGTGLSPVSLSDISPFSGVLVPTATKESWLQRIGTGTERGGADAGMNILAISFRRVGFQLGASGYGVANLNGDAVESILFGNAGRTGTAKDFRYNGSNANGGGFATAALGFALPVSSSATSELALGVTGKYIAGMGVGRAMDNGSTVTSNNINVQFPMIYSTSTSEASGSGMGLDLGLMWKGGANSFGVTAKNVVNTFEWDTSMLRSRLGVVKFDGNKNTTDFDESPYSAAPASLRAAIENEKFKPEVALGFARRMSSLLMTADASMHLSDDGIQMGPKSHVGVGAEFTGIPMLPLRAGVAAVTGGVQAAGGLGLRIGGFEIGAGISVRTREGGGSDMGGMLSLISIGNH